ncbi:MAG: GNAT family N-acetyltransferase [Anaerolineales bacterium]|nr:GNAT family N-acetyltransferase [Anaerolineales bacterium]
MKVRAALPADASEIAHVHVASFRSAHAGLLPEDFLANLSVDAREDMWRRMLTERAETHFLFVAVDGERIIGFAAGGPPTGDEPGGQPTEASYAGKIYTIYLLPEAQGQGAGRGLLERILAEFGSRGQSPVFLWVLKENVQARGFYEHMGGTQVAEKQEELAGTLTQQVAYAWPKDVISSL